VTFYRKLGPSKIVVKRAKHWDLGRVEDDMGVLAGCGCGIFEMIGKVEFNNAD
jgi:hypothetical protein